MDLNSFTASSEDILCSDTVKLNERNGLNEIQKGQLACTSGRVVFVTDDNVININPSAVSSIEYTPSTWLNTYTIVAAAFGVLAVLSWLFFDPVSGILPFSREVVSGILALIGGASLLEAVFRFGGELKILTQKKTYEFQTSNNQFAKKMCAAIHQTR